MPISGLDTVASGGTGSLGQGKEALGKNDFLFMLITQLKAQNPLNPMDSTAFTAQLAQFSSLEQLNNVNESLGYLMLYQSSINNSQAVNFIGKSVKAYGDSIQLTDGVSDNINIDLSADASKVTVDIYDSDDNLIKTIESENLDAGEQNINWDGTDNDGNQVADGLYTFEVSSTDNNGDQVGVSTFLTARITGITFKDGITYLLAGEREIPIGNIIEVLEG